MEITLDMGSNLYNQLAKFADSESLDIGDFTLNMTELGLRIFLASKEQGADSTDELKMMVNENNAILHEVMRCVFDPSKVDHKVFDAQALLTLITSETKNGA